MKNLKFEIFACEESIKLMEAHMYNVQVQPLSFFLYFFIFCFVKFETNYMNVHVKKKS